MPSKSEKQRRLFGAALAIKRGKTPKSKKWGKAAELAKKMTEKQLEDFTTKEDIEIISNLISDDINSSVDMNMGRESAEMQGDLEGISTDVSSSGGSLTKEISHESDGKRRFVKITADFNDVPQNVINHYIEKVIDEIEKEIKS